MKITIADHELRAWLRMTCDPHAKLNNTYCCSPWTMPQISAMVSRLEHELADVKKRFEEKLMEPIPVLRLEDYDAGYAACERDVVAWMKRRADDYYRSAGLEGHADALSIAAEMVEHGDARGARDALKGGG